MDTLGDQFEPRPVVSLPDFPAWNLYPDGRWNYALCLDDESIKDIQVQWNEACIDPWDASHPALKVRVKARRVRGWRIVHARRARQFGHWIDNGKFRRGIRTVSGDFYYTPPLPDPQGLAKRLSDRVEAIELIPYGATLLRITVFPRI